MRTKTSPKQILTAFPLQLHLNIGTQSGVSPNGLQLSSCWAFRGAQPDEPALHYVITNYHSDTLRQQKKRVASKSAAGCKHVFEDGILKGKEFDSTSAKVFEYLYRNLNTTAGPRCREELRDPLCWVWSLHSTQS